MVSLSKSYRVRARVQQYLDQEHPHLLYNLYSYKVRIINPSKKSDVVSRYLNNYSSKFASVNAIRLQLIEEFKDQVPDSLSFLIGYFEGSQQAKISLVTDEDLKRLYDIHKTGGQINMWCEGVPNEGANKGQSGSKRK